MDKKNLIIAVSVVSLGALAYEYRNLYHDFKLLAGKYKEAFDLLDEVGQIYVDEIFDDIVENLDED